MVWLDLLLALAFGLAALWDVRTRRIPDALPLAVLALAAARAPFVGDTAPLAELFGGAALGAAVGAIAFACGLIGGGDAKLLAALCAAVGASGSLFALAATALAGGALSGGFLLARRRDVPYAVAIGAGFACTLATHVLAP
jgi:prepilin peptidase CpaA